MPNYPQNPYDPNQRPQQGQPYRPTQQYQPTQAYQQPTQTYQQPVQPTQQYQQPGQQFQNPYGQAPMNNGNMNNGDGKATAAIVCSIIGIFIGGLIMQIIAKCLSVSANNSFKRCYGPQAIKPSKFKVASVLTTVMLILSIISTIAMGAFICNYMSTYDNSSSITFNVNSPNDAVTNTNKNNTNANANAISNANVNSNTSSSTNNSAANAATSAASWASGVFEFDGKQYTLGQTKCSDLAASGWTVASDFTELESMKYDIVSLKNETKYGSSYTGLYVSASFMNETDSTIAASDTVLKGMTVEIANLKDGVTAPTCILPGNVTFGAQLSDIEKAYGTEHSTYRSDEMKYTVYTYENDNYDKVRLTVYDDGGLKSIEYALSSWR